MFAHTPDGDLLQITAVLDRNGAGPVLVGRNHHEPVVSFALYFKDITHTLLELFVEKSEIHVVDLFIGIALHPCAASVDTGRDSFEECRQPAVSYHSEWGVWFCTKHAVLS